jgi:hypothetical protein
VELTSTGQQSPYTYNLPGGYAAKVQRGQGVQQGQPLAVQIPTFGNNLEWFFTYQLGFMYWRYFMWNFSGRQNDLQGLGMPGTATGYQAYRLLTILGLVTRQTCRKA